MSNENHYENYYFQCVKCTSPVDIDTDSFETFIMGKEDWKPILKTIVKGYCSNCNFEHTFEIQDVTTIKEVR